MPLLGSAAMLLSFDVDADAVDEHDDWHTHEHLPERLSIPGFLRGTRWVAVEGQPRYLVLYEVERLDTLHSAAYLERLNHPTPWTARMMKHYRGMRRGLCEVAGSAGAGVGQVALLARFSAAPGREAHLLDWLVHGILAELPQRPGLGSAHLLRGAAAAPMTNEQRLRGADAGVDWALLVTAYSDSALADVARDALSGSRFTEHGGVDARTASYRLHYTLTASDLAAGRST
jgi:hypothetical protein